MCEGFFLQVGFFGEIYMIDIFVLHNLDFSSGHWSKFLENHQKILSHFGL